MFAPLKRLVHRVSARCPLWVATHFAKQGRGGRLKKECLMGDGNGPPSPPLLNTHFSGKTAPRDKTGPWHNEDENPQQHLPLSRIEPATDPTAS